MQGRTNDRMENPIRQRRVKLSPLELQSLFRNVNADAKISLQMKIDFEYWNLGDFSKQLLYLRNSIDVNPCHKKYNPESRRSRTCVYKLRGNKVCKKYFMATLCLSDGSLTVACRKIEGNKFSDLRGPHGNHKKIDEAELSLVRSHIESFPAVESHYTRKSSQRKYLAANLNITIMWEEFKKKHPTSKILAHTYRRIFCNEYNYSFHRPKKDSCLTCVK